MLKMGTLATGASGTDTLCTNASIPCYEFVVDGRSEEYPSEVSWTVDAPDGGSTLWEGGAVAWEATTVSTCTADPTSTPVPTTTANPTDPPVEVRNATELDDAVARAASRQTIVVTAAVVELADTLRFPEGLAEVALKGGRAGTTLRGNGPFGLIDVVRTELTLEDLVLTGGASNSGRAVAVEEGVLSRQCRSHAH